MVRNILSLSLSVVVMVLLFSACEEDPNATTTEQGKAIITGFVRDASTTQPLAGVTVEAFSITATPLTPTTVVTGDDGKYAFEFELDSTASVTLNFSKSGYTGGSATVEIRSGVVERKDQQLTSSTPIGGGGGTVSSGNAQTIAFISAEPQEVSVYGVGGEETSILIWEVRDSLGLPIDAAHAVTLAFSIVGGPGGGEYVSPASLTTNGVGRAVNTFNSGIRSGVAQVVATTTVGGRTITSSPVRLVIHGGLPHQAHFTIGPEQFNFPALGIFGLRDPISVLVGDRYSNPVVSGTAVYFRSSAGVIQASTFTDEDGQGTVDLISGNPQPFGIYAANPPGDGYHWIVGRTVGEAGAIVTDSTMILWSGRSLVSNISPSPFDIANRGSQTFTFTVSDALGHPLSAGTTISVSAQVAAPQQAVVFFGLNGSVTLEDVMFPGTGTTLFTCTLADDAPDTALAPSAATLVVTVTSPNGDTYGTASGTIR